MKLPTLSLNCAVRLAEILKSHGTAAALQRHLHLRAGMVGAWRRAESFPHRKFMRTLCAKFPAHADEIECLFAAHYARAKRRSRHVRAEHPEHEAHDEFWQPYLNDAMGG